MIFKRHYVSSRGAYWLHPVDEVGVATVWCCGCYLQIADSCSYPHYDRESLGYAHERCMGNIYEL